VTPGALLSRPGPDTARNSAAGRATGSVMWWRRRARRIACREVVERLTDYLDDALAPGERTRLEAHLDACPDCAATVAAFVQTINALGALPPEDVAVPDETLAVVLSAFRRAPPRP
jgi:predicted anti-sigma-YlaC factor YlaD